MGPGLNALVVFHSSVINPGTLAIYSLMSWLLNSVLGGKYIIG